MIKRQKMLIVTCFYDPAVTGPEAIVAEVSPITAAALFSGIGQWLEKGGVVRLSHIEADLVPLAGGQNGSHPAHEWVGLTFVPVQPAATEVIVMEEVVDAY
ncbi:MAG: hypothetical protein KF770_05410 [Anaerolineae bacterium]|nr:hypothetical protein [Anaerolineae bacterium]